jgi:hypothetical protein
MRCNWAWPGRTVRVRGVAMPAGCVARESMLCMKESSSLSYIVDPTEIAPLPLARTGPHPLLAVVRQVSLLGGLAPRAQDVR